MKKYIKFGITLTTFLLSLGLVSSGFSYFIFNENSKVENEVTPNVNINQFNNIENTTYTIYFFASPYYACGLPEGYEGYKNNYDALDIANLSNNPYNDTSAYAMKASSLIGTSVYANNTNTKINGNYTYVSAKNVNNDEQGNLKNVELATKRDFTGSLYDSSTGEISYTYIKKTVNGVLSQSILDSLTCSTLFHDENGYTPKFKGWTYNRNESKYRAIKTINGYDYLTYFNYKTNGGYSSIDENGNELEDKNEYGNYGSSTPIQQMSESVSLETVDTLKSKTYKNSNNKDTQDESIDGSGNGDHVIYLYPVYDAPSLSTDNNYTYDLIRFRNNPDDSKVISTSPNYTEEGEYDPSKNRYTRDLYRIRYYSNKNDNDISIGNDSENCITHYYNGLYISKDNDLQLDILTKNNDKSNSDSTLHNNNWVTILSKEKIKNLNLNDGYYKVFVYYTRGKDIKDSSLQTTYNNFINTKWFKNDDNAKSTIITSLNSSGNIGIETINPIQNSTNTSKIGYIIGFKKLNNYELSSTSSTGFNDPSNTLFIESSFDISNNNYETFEIKNKYLNEGYEFNIIDDYNSKYDIDNTYNSLITAYNTYREGKEGEICYVDFKNISSSSFFTKVSDNTYKVNESGRYSFAFIKNYTDGKIVLDLVVRKENTKFTILFFEGYLPEKAKAFTSYEEFISLDNYMGRVIDKDSTSTSSNERYVNADKDVFIYNTNKYETLYDKNYKEKTFTLSNVLKGQWKGYIKTNSWWPYNNYQSKEYNYNTDPSKNTSYRIYDVTNTLTSGGTLIDRDILWKDNDKDYLGLELSKTLIYCLIKK